MRNTHKLFCTILVMHDGVEIVMYIKGFVI